MCKLSRFVLSNCRTSLLKTFAFLIETILGQKKSFFVICKRTASKLAPHYIVYGHKARNPNYRFRSKFSSPAASKTAYVFSGHVLKVALRFLERRLSEHVIYQTVINVFHWQALSVN